MLEKTSSKFSLKQFALDLGVDVVIVVVLVIIIRLFLFAPFRVHGSSMCDNFNYYNGECYNGDGELVITSRLATWDVFGFSLSHLERGDVIIFKAPYSVDKEYYIKRVIGLPGDTIKIEDGFVYFKNGEEFVKLNETYLNETNWGHTEPYRAKSQTFEVPDGTYFVLGDNRLQSSDARRCFQSLGCSDGASPYLDEDSIAGEVKLVVFPLTHIRWVAGFDYEF